jgi:hypothetical protein
MKYRFLRMTRIVLYSVGSNATTWSLDGHSRDKGVSPSHVQHRALLQRDSVGCITAPAQAFDRC